MAQYFAYDSRIFNTGEPEKSGHVEGGDQIGSQGGGTMGMGGTVGGGNRGGTDGGFDGDGGFGGFAGNGGFAGTGGGIGGFGGEGGGFGGAGGDPSREGFSCPSPDNDPEFICRSVCQNFTECALHGGGVYGARGSCR